VLLFCAARLAGDSTPRYVEFHAARETVSGAPPARDRRANPARQFAQSLEESQSIEECWETLQHVSRAFGFAGVRLSFEGRVLEQLPPGAYTPCWSVRVLSLAGLYQSDAGIRRVS